ncbi:MAG: cobalt-precorrin 5A hydrolase [Thermodesulfobacteriota bacterium]|nr:cobalt-precorrin 5A hydrolase [Thermodesulfobacteriota bacterium]
MDTESNSKFGYIHRRSKIQEAGIAVICLREAGLDLAERLSGFLPGVKIYAYDSSDRKNPNVRRFSSLTVLMEKIWLHYDAYVFIMAVGIVVRVIAPLIRDKKIDPAVVVIDEKAAFVISLLSGHIGGANRLTSKIAGFLKAHAVITTGSDVNEKTALDIWALERDLYVEDWEKLKRLSARIVNGENVSAFVDSLVYELPKELTRVSSPKDALLIITNRVMPYEALYLRPRNLVLGIGCNKGTEEKEIVDVIESVFSTNRFSLHSIRNLATIDLKKTEKGLISFAKRHGFLIDFFPKEKLNRVRNVKSSEASIKATGARAVAEPSAILSARSALVIEKQKRGNVTLAVANSTLLG